MLSTIGLCVNNFKWTQITSILRVSDRTLRRGPGKEELNMNDKENFTNMSDDELFEVITEVWGLTPNIGQSRMMGAHRSRSLQV